MVAAKQRQAALTRFWVCVPSLAVCHFIVQLVTLLAVVGSGMARFDSGAEPSMLEQILSLINMAVSFPLVTLARLLPLHGSAQLGWFIFLANSILWGLFAWLGLRWFSSRPAKAL